MPHPESVILTLSHTRESADALVFAVGLKLFFPAGKNFVPVSLMAHIPHYLVIRGIIDIMQCDGQLNHPQAGAEMARIGADLVNDILPELIA